MSGLCERRQQRDVYIAVQEARPRDLRDKLLGSHSKMHYQHVLNCRIPGSIVRCNWLTRQILGR
jgi:hypothetical protein